MSAKKSSKRLAARKKASKPAKQNTRKKTADRPSCGLCGATENLIKTECCNHWICDDEHTYVMFSYSRDSCSRNHDRYTVCGYHFNEGHSGHWKVCKKCREDFEPELYADAATNAYNFEPLDNVPDFEPTHCARCNTLIRLAEGGYSSGPGGCLCGSCTAREFGDLFR